MEDNSKKSDLQQKISARIKKVMDDQGINQSTLVEMANQSGYCLRQSTVSKMLHGASSMSITNIVQIASILKLDLNDLLSESDNTDVRVYRPIDSTQTESRLIRRADTPEMRPYLNSYYTYFYPTLSSDERILTGILKFESSIDGSKCIAKFSFETGKTDAYQKTIKKEYEGDLILSQTMSAAYCTLVNEEIGEISYLLFNYMPIIYEELCCRVALVLTSSAGSNRMPTAHRMILSKKAIPDEAIEILEGQLRLNESEILISESGLDRFLDDGRLDHSFKKYFSKAGQDTKFLGLSPVPYYLFDESVIRSSFLEPEVKTKAISLIRKYSASPKYNKIGSKCDELVYRFIDNLEDPKESDAK